MGKRYWVISISAVTLMVALTTLVMGSYSLFSQKIELTNHFVTGELKLDLYRTSLIWSELDENGLLITHVDDETYNVKDLNNLFETASHPKVIIPGVFYESQMMIVNRGNVRFNYYIEIILKGESNELAEQLEVTFMMNEQVIKNKLSNGLYLGTVNDPLGHAITDEEINFTIKVEFIKDANNNDAQALALDFDFIVYAVQSTN